VPYESAEDSEVRALLGGPSLELHDAAAEGDCEAVARLLAEGLPVEGRDPGDRTPLLCAAEEGHAEVVAALLKAGADHTATDNEGYTALHHAAAARAVDCVTALLAAGADANAVTDMAPRPSALLQICGERGRERARPGAK
jgi:ankyrin repeat protein